MDVLDAVVVVVAVGAAVGGFRLGFLTRVASWVGLAAGLYLAARVLPKLLDAANLSAASSRLLITIGLLLLGAVVGQVVGMVAGARLHEILPAGPAREVDRGIGAAAGALGVVALLWLLVPTLASVPGWPAQAAQGSAIARYVSNHLPPPPNTFQTLRRLVGQQGFPEVFNGLTGGGTIGSPPTANPLTPALTASVAQSTVKVEGQACSRIQDGSGFAVAPDLIATNAHVVAGEPAGHTEVLTYAGRTLPATVVLFDPNRDLALLSVAHLDDAPLPLATGSQGEKGAIFGHPGGQDPLAVIPAQIAEEISAVGSNLYDTATTTRDVFVMAAHVIPGDSGGALVDTSGAVIGVTFATDAANPDKSYSLSTKELRAVLAEPRGAPVSTRSCINS